MAKQDEKEKKKILPIIIIFVVVTAVLIGGYFLYQKFGGSLFGGGEPQTAEERLEQYFDNSKKHGTFTYYNLLDDTAATQDGEYWVDGDLFKIQFLQSDGYKRWIITPDGEVPYFCYEEDEQCHPSMSTVENYLLRWSKPESDLEFLQTDADNNCDEYLYTIDKTFEREGATNAYYVKNITYCVNADQLVYRTHDGNVANEDGTLGTRSYSKFVMGDDIEFTLDSGVSFELPYEIVNE